MRYRGEGGRVGGWRGGAELVLVFFGFFFFRFLLAFVGFVSFSFAFFTSCFDHFPSSRCND